MLKDGFVTRQKFKALKEQRKAWHYYIVTSIYTYLELPSPKTLLKDNLPEKIWTVLDLYCETHNKDPETVMADAIAHYVLTVK